MAAAAPPALGLVGQWLACLQRTCLVPSRAMEGVNVGDVDEFVLHFYMLALVAVTA